MGQLLIHPDSRKPYILCCGDSLTVSTQKQWLQLGSKTSSPLLCFDTKTGFVTENHWHINAGTHRRYKMIAEMLAECHGWIVASHGGSGTKLQYTMAIGSTNTVIGVSAVIRYEISTHKINIVDTHGNGQIIEMPHELIPYELDIVDLIAASHGLPSSEYSHIHKAVIWRGFNGQ